MPKTGTSSIKRQKEILRAIIEASGHLFNRQDILSALDGVVSTIGARFGADKCLIYGKGLTQGYIEDRMLQLAGFNSKDASITAQDYDCYEFINCKECFEPIMRDLIDFGFFESEDTFTGRMAALQEQGIGYILVYPLFVKETLWGILTLGYAKNKEHADESRKRALETLSKNISSTVEKFFVTKQLDDIKLELLCINQNLEAAAAKAIEDKLKIEQEKLQRERELFEVKEKYHLLQQDDAYRKQIKILKDDLSHKVEAGFLFETLYKPIDILSGDIYGLIKVSDKKALVYIIDAMGKGLSASVTAVISAAFLNDSVGKSKADGDFDFTKTVTKYQSFIQKQINEDEIVCAAFAFIDEESGTLEISNFSMPEILYLENGNLKTAKANNHPITAYFTGVKVDKIPLLNIERILISSDGLKDIRLEGGGIYKNIINEDFVSSPTKNIFLKKLFSKALNPEDDLTFAFISRYEPKTLSKQLFLINPTIEEMTECVDVKLRENLQKYFDGKRLMQLECAINEMLMNAIEHGVLGITYPQKNALLESYMYEEYLEEAIGNLENVEDKKIAVSYEEILINEAKAVIIRISDNGDGFDVATTLKTLSFDKNIRFNGRGILMSDNILDALFYNDKGNEAYMIKFI